MTHTDIYIRDGINELCRESGERARRAGWWSGTTDPSVERYEVGTKIALIHSEISEALEGYRKDAMDDKLPHRKQIEVELADALIRIGDAAYFLKLDLGGAVLEKMAFNLKRAYHSKKVREAHGGKKF